MNDLQRIIWLASFPKSGNTWARTFLANYFQPPGKAVDINSLRQFTTADVRQDFFDKADGGRFRGKTVSDWIKVRPKALRLIAASKSGHHFVKTHCQVGNPQPLRRGALLRPPHGAEYRRGARPDDQPPGGACQRQRDHGNNRPLG
jgi:hypothetical protein